MITYFNQKWKEIYPYSQNLTIDESMTTYKGKIIFEQFVEDKLKKFGIKFFNKSNSTNGMFMIYSLIQVKDLNIIKIMDQNQVFS